MFDTGSGSAAYIRSGDDCILLGCGGDTFHGAYNIKKTLNDYSNETDAVILPEDTADYNSYLSDIGKFLQKADIYCSEPGYALELAFPENKIIAPQASFNSGEIKVTPCSDISGNTAYIIETKDLNLLWICDPGIDF